MNNQSFIKAIGAFLMSIIASIVANFAWKFMPFDSITVFVPSDFLKTQWFSWSSPIIIIAFVMITVQLINRLKFFRSGNNLFKKLQIIYFIFTILSLFLFITIFIRSIHELDLPYSDYSIPVLAIYYLCVWLIEMFAFYLGLRYKGPFKNFNYLRIFI